jgi:hypothetical protein
MTPLQIECRPYPAARRDTQRLEASLLREIEGAAKALASIGRNIE